MLFSPQKLKISLFLITCTVLTACGEKDKAPDLAQPSALVEPKVEPKKVETPKKPPLLDSLQLTGQKTQVNLFSEPGTKFDLPDGRTLEISKIFSQVANGRAAEVVIQNQEGEKVLAVAKTHKNPEYIQEEIRRTRLVQGPGMVKYLGHFSGMATPEGEQAHESPVLLIEKLDKVLTDVPYTHEHFVSLAKTLQRLHAIPFVHGDIKPTNIMFSFAGVPTFLDLGESQGTLGYQAPFTGQNLGLTTVSDDLYAFGVSMYEWKKQDRLKKSRPSLFTHAKFEGYHRGNFIKPVVEAYFKGGTSPEKVQFSQLSGGNRKFFFRQQEVAPTLRQFDYYNIHKILIEQIEAVANLPREQLMNRTLDVIVQAYGTNRSFEEAQLADASDAELVVQYLTATYEQKEVLAHLRETLHRRCFEDLWWDRNAADEKVMRKLIEQKYGSIDTALVDLTAE